MDKRSSVHQYFITTVEKSLNFLGKYSGLSIFKSIFLKPVESKVSSFLDLHLKVKAKVTSETILFPNRNTYFNERIILHSFKTSVTTLRSKTSRTFQGKIVLINTYNVYALSLNILR